MFFFSFTDYLLLITFSYQGNLKLRIYWPVVLTSSQPRSAWRGFVVFILDGPTRF